MQTAMACVDVCYASVTLKLTTLTEKHAREELETSKGQLTTVSAPSLRTLRAELWMPGITCVVQFALLFAASFNTLHEPTQARQFEHQKRERN